MKQTLRQAAPDDLGKVLALYAHLHPGATPTDPETAAAVWRRMMADPGHKVLLCEAEGEPVASCVLLIVPNLSHGGRPYGLIENVVTHPGFRRRGFGQMVLAFARELAQKENCYKLMLMTSGRQAGTHGFYQKAGYNAADKTAYVQWLDN